jgi:hypothetical protein
MKNVLFVSLLVFVACGNGRAAETSLPDPALDDRPPHSAPELPRIAVELPPASSSKHPERPVGRGEDLQHVINDAMPGDVITLPPGAIFKGPITLPAKNGNDWITIQSNAAGPAGQRAEPQQGNRAVIESDDNLAIVASPGAHHYRFVGVEVRPPARTFISTLINLGTDFKSVDDLPHHIVFERCYIHGDAVVGGRRGIGLNARHAAVIDSYLSDFKEKGADSQAIAGWNGAGPFAIINNYIEAAGENLMFGGADPDIENLVPSDIEIRNNDFVKPLSWKTSGAWTVKNLFELKNARRVLIDGNTFENNWADAQNGFAILFTVRNQDGGSPWSMVRDITFTHNIVRHTAGGINVLGTDDLHPSQQTKRISIADNLFDDVELRLFQMLDGPADVVIDHNTAFQRGDILIGEGTPTSGFVYRNNLTPHNQFGVGGSNTFGNPPAALATYFPGAVFTHNVLIGGRAELYPANNFFPATAADVRFIDLAHGDYRLASDSPYRNAGTDGKDIGALFLADGRGRRRSVK